jgi:hypothetical protein
MESADERSERLIADLIVRVFVDMTTILVQDV